MLQPGRPEDHGSISGGNNPVSLSSPGVKRAVRVADRLPVFSVEV